MARASLPEKFLFGFLPLLRFYHLQSIPSFIFPWKLWWSLWLCWISLTFSVNLLSRIAVPYQRPSCQSVPLLCFSTSFRNPWVCACLYMIIFFLLFSSGILSVLPELVDGIETYYRFLLLTERSGFAPYRLDMLSAYC